MRTQLVFKNHVLLTNLLWLVVFLSILSCNSAKQSLLKGNQKKYYVILMGGQSNMVGSGRVADLDTAIIPHHIQYFNWGKRANLLQDSTTFGPEIGLSQVLHQHFPDSNFILVKYAIGGASLLDWAPNYDSARATITGNAHFGAMYDSLWKYIDQATVNYSTETIALLWMQGERDARIPKAGVDYYPHFKNFIKQVRQDTNRPNLPIVFGQVNPDPSRYTAVDTVRAAQSSIARELDYVWMIDTSNLGKWDDKVHYNSAGQLELGQRFGQALVEHWKATNSYGR